MVNVHHQADRIERFLAAHDLGAQVVVSREPDGALETGGGLWHARGLFRGDGPILLHNVDVITDADLGAMVDAHRRSGALATLAVNERETSRYLLFDPAGLFGRVDHRHGMRSESRPPRGEVRTLAHSFNEMAEQLKTQRQSLEDRHQQLLRVNEVLEQLSITDGLTHLHNHRHFHDQFARETKRADRSGAPLCLLLIDLDDFKALNDRHGHAVGDHLLSLAAGLMNAQVRESDYLARYGIRSN